MSWQTALFLLSLFPAGLVSAQSVAGACARGFGNDSVGCAVDRPCFTGIGTEGTTLRVSWTATQDFDHYDFRWSRPGKPEEQSEVAGGRAGTFQITNAHACADYTIKVQGCQNPLIGSSSCTAWEEQSYRTPPSHPYGDDSCAQGFVWRGAFPGDHVCVLPAERDQAAADNSQAANRRNPNGDTCKPGFVWREARPQDHVCVVPQIREQARTDNAMKCSRLAGCP